MDRSLIFENTICALATGNGGALGIIRVSGAESLAICGKFFSPSNKRLILGESQGYTILFGEIVDGGQVIDEVLVSVFRSPRSYTGEDSVEISCHASRYIQKRILELLIENGAVAARPGEFTQRAFFNGKIDLSQAEAVADLIASESKLAHKIAIEQMRGSFSDEIGQLRSQLLHFATMIELELDFSEEDVEFADRKKLKKIIEKSLSVSERLTSSFSMGNVIKNGIPVAIIGNPNTGKSTLLNSLLNEERAIVSEIPGTTRDTIEDVKVIDNIQFRFIDTAGIRQTDDIIENMGIARTMEKIEKAQVILLVADINSGVQALSQFLEDIRNKIEGSDKELIVLVNKIDGILPGSIADFVGQIPIYHNEKLLFISAKTGEGMEGLIEVLSSIALRYIKSTENVIVSNIRHYEALIQVNQSLKRVIHGLDLNLSGDLIAMDLRQAIHYFGSITGQITNDEILGNIFKNFCIGK